MSTFVVGDIHAGYRALKQLLDQITVQPKDQFIFVGDYVDGWSEAVETISFLIQFSKNNDCIFLRGNHDELLYNFLKHGDNNPLWLQHGGMSTKKVIQIFQMMKRQFILRFLNNFKIII